MFKPIHKPQAKRSATSSRVRGPLSRRLAVETLEKRLVLSSPDIDRGIWNHDERDQFVIIDSYSVGPTAPDGALTPSQLNDGFGPWQLFDHPVVNIFQNHFDERPSISFGGLATAAFPAVEPPAAPLNTSPAEALTGGVAGNAYNMRVDSNVLMVFNPSVSVGFSKLGELAIHRTRLPHFEAANDTAFADPRGEGMHRTWVTLTSIGDVFGGAYLQQGEFLLDAMNEIGKWASSGQGEFSSWLFAAESAAPETSVEGGAISLESIVAHVGGGSMPMIDGGPQMVDWTPRGFTVAEAAAMPASYTISGELARAVAFEVIDGEAAPIVYAATEESGSFAMMSEPFAEGGGSYSARQATVVLPAGQLGDAGAPTRHFHDRLAAREELRRSHVSAYEWALATFPFAEESASDVARGEVFSQLGEISQDSEPLEGEHGPRLWLGAMPVLALLTAERIVAAKKKADREKAERLSV